MFTGLPPEVHRVIKRLNEHGMEAYLVGGCVRDLLLQKPPKDWDIATEALPEVVMSLFEKTIPTGLKHGTVTVIEDKMPIEITTFRVEGEYLDGRRPSGVKFSNNLIEDLSRRDFTINAMAFHPENGLVDMHGGLLDLQSKVIRTVGNPKERFEEDSLRMLRAIRFAIQLDFEVEERTLEAIRENASTIHRVSAQRVRDELNKMLMGNAVEKIYLLHETYLMQEILPEVAVLFSIPRTHINHRMSVGRHTLEALHITPHILLVRWAVLLHDIGKACGEEEHAAVGASLCEAIGERLKFDHKLKEQVCKLVRYHDLSIEPTEAGVRQAMYKVGEADFETLLSVMRANQWSTKIDQLGKKIMSLLAIAIMTENIKEQKQCISLKQLAVNGKDLVEMGYSGIAVGKRLEELMQEVLVDPTLNKKETLLQMVK